MSELTLCNFCSLRDIRARAAAEGKVVTVQGSDVFVHTKGETLVSWTMVEDPKYVGPKANQVSWMMEIGTSCCC